jgi:uncharacterized protein DUF6228
MSKSVIIRSSLDGTTLELFDRTEWDFAVRVDGPNFHGTASIYSPKLKHLSQFFTGMSEPWKGWSGERGWQSLERELSLSAKADSTGHVDIFVELCSRQHFLGWTLTCTLVLEAGATGVDRHSDSAVCCRLIESSRLCPHRFQPLRRVSANCVHQASCKSRRFPNPAFPALDPDPGDAKQFGKHRLTHSQLVAQLSHGGGRVFVGLGDADSSHGEALQRDPLFDRLCQLAQAVHDIIRRPPARLLSCFSWHSDSLSARFVSSLY